MKLLEPYNGKELPRLETERLILRQRTADDVEDMFAYAGLPEVCYPAGFPPVGGLEAERDYFENRYFKNLEKRQLPSG